MAMSIPRAASASIRSLLNRPQRSEKRALRPPTTCWLAAYADTVVLTGKDTDFERDLSRPLTTLAAWAGAQTWSAAA